MKRGVKFLVSRCSLTPALRFRVAWVPTTRTRLLLKIRALLQRGRLFTCFTSRLNTLRGRRQRRTVGRTEFTIELVMIIPFLTVRRVLILTVKLLVPREWVKPVSVPFKPRRVPVAIRRFMTLILVRFALIRGHFTQIRWSRRSSLMRPCRIVCHRLIFIIRLMLILPKRRSWGRRRPILVGGYRRILRWQPKGPNWVKPVIRVLTLMRKRRTRLPKIPWVLLPRMIFLNRHSFLSMRRPWFIKFLPFVRFRVILLTLFRLIPLLQKLESSVLMRRSSKGEIRTGFRESSVC